MASIKPAPTWSAWAPASTYDVRARACRLYLAVALNLSCTAACRGYTYLESEVCRVPPWVGVCTTSFLQLRSWSCWPVVVTGPFPTSPRCHPRPGRSFQTAEIATARPTLRTPQAMATSTPMPIRSSRRAATATPPRRPHPVAPRAAQRLAQRRPVEQQQAQPGRRPAEPPPAERRLRQPVEQRLRQPVEQRPVEPPHPRAARQPVEPPHPRPLQPSPAPRAAQATPRTTPASSMPSTAVSMA